MYMHLKQEKMCISQVFFSLVSVMAVRIETAQNKQTHVASFHTQSSGGWPIKMFPPYDR